MKTILVPIDFSPVSVNALDYAVGLAKVIHAKLIVFNTYNPSQLKGVFSSNKSMDEEKKITLASEHFDLLNNTISPYNSEKYIHNGGSLQIIPKVKAGEVVNNIVSEAVNNKADYIIMGTKGETGLKTKIWGSVTSNVVQATKIPVWVIPENAMFNGIDQILYASDLNYEDKKNLDHLLNLGKNFDALTTCLHINIDYLNVNTEEFVFERLKEKYNKDNVVFKFKEGYNAMDELNKYISDHPVKLLAVLPKEKSFIQQAFNKSISRNLTLHSHTPLLIFHDINHKNIIS